MRFLSTTTIGRKIRSVPQSFVDVPGLQVRIGLEDRFFALAGSKKPEEAGERKRKSAGAGFSGANTRIHGNAFELHVFFLPPDYILSDRESSSAEGCSAERDPSC
jgi:hypothetical protein